MTEKRRAHLRPAPVTTRWVEPTPNVGEHGDEPATEKQLEYVANLARELFTDPPEVRTRYDAAMAIGRLKQDKRRLRV